MENLEPLDIREYNEAIEPMASMNGYAGTTVFRNRVVGFDLIMTGPLIRGGVGMIRPLKFENCTFKGEVELGGRESSGHILFEDCAFDEFLKCEDNTEFRGTTRVRVARITLNTRDCVKGFEVSGKLIVESIGSVKLEEINNNRQSMQGSLEIIGAMGLSIDNAKFCSCDLKSSRVGLLKLYRVEMEELSIGQMGGHPAAVSIAASKFDYLYSEEPQHETSSLEISKGCKIKLLRFKLSSFHEFTCAMSQIEVLDLSGENRERDLIDVWDVTFCDLIFHDLRNKGLMSFSSVALVRGGCLTMRMASLGKTDFIQCNFEAGYFEFENSKITETFMANSDFARKVVVKEKELFAEERLAFGQIATAFQRQGDTVRYLEYQSREIEAHYKALKYFPAGLTSISFTKLSLWLNRVSNDFGRNWFRGIVFSFVIGLVFFYLLVISSSEYTIGWGFHVNGRLVGSFLKFMNPLRFFETESLFRSGTDKSYLTLSGWSYVIDFFSRVMVVYGFYQTIQAFRRYGRSR